MIEVLCSFNCTPSTFFMAIDIMDNYMSLATKSIEPKDVHLIGVTSMLIASKIEEIIPFKVSTVVEKMTHGKMTAKQIVACEEEILKTVGYNLYSLPSLYTFVEFLTVMIGIHETDFNDQLMKILNYVTKMIMHDYDIIRNHSIKYLASSCLFIAFKIIEQLNKDFKTKSYIEKLKHKLRLNEEVFFSVSEQMLDLAKSFEKRYPFAKNLSKFESFTIETI